MKKSLRKFSILLLLVVSFVDLQANQLDKKSEFNRSFHETYSINADAELRLSNTFTNVEIINWDKDEIDITVDITIKAKSESNAQKLFDKIKVEMSGNSNEVSLETYLKNGTNTNDDWSIVATIYAPSSIDLDADIEFGNLYCNIIAGVCDVEMEFGNVTGSFPNPNNEFSIEYGNFEAPVLGCKKLRVEFGGLEVGVLTSSCELSIDFSKAKIKALGETCENLSAQVEFGSLRISFLKGSNFAITASASFGDIDFDKPFNIESSESGMFDASYTASIGNKTGNINVESSYSDIKFVYDR